MLETPHVMVGAAIAVKVGNPLLAIPLAFASHFVLEKIPHWNPHLNTETKIYGRPTKKSTVITFVDTSLALASGTFIASRAIPDWGLFLTIMFSSFFSVLPDLIEAPYFFLNLRPKIIKRWINFQVSIQSDTNIYLGLFTQLLIILASLWWILH